MSGGQTSEQAAGQTAGDTSGLIQQIRAYPRLPLIVGVAVAVAVLAGLLLWSRTPDYAVLFSSLSNRDGGDIIAKLDTLQEPYHFAANGSTILVPRADVDRIRLTLAGEGLPKGGGVGFELMDKEPFGISQFAEHVNYDRALEGELARSIESISQVDSARVQLAIPKSSVFVRDQKNPTASVVLKLYAGRALSNSQVTAITHLVASAVPDLPVDSVTVVDSAGHLLSSQGGGDDGGVDTSRLSYVNQVEQAYRKRIRDILAPIVGADNIRAQVVADVDFSVNESTRDNYAPNQKPDQAAVRSEQRSENLSDGGAGISGIPGALSNQPSPDAQSPINNPKKSGGGGSGQNTATASNNLSLAPADGLAPDGRKGSTTTRSTVNYELDHVIQHIKQPVGRIKRISAAVVINDPNADTGAGTGKNPKTKTAHAAAISAQRMAQIKSLVQGAIGFSQQRGDTVDVINMPFTQTNLQASPARPPWWANRQLQSLLIQALKYLLIAIVAWLLWRKLVKPLIERTPRLTALQPALATASGPMPEENENAEDRLRNQRRQQSANLVKNTQNIARDDPRMVAMIVKGWMNDNG